MIEQGAVTGSHKVVGLLSIDDVGLSVEYQQRQGIPV